MYLLFAMPISIFAANIALVDQKSTPIQILNKVIAWAIIAAFVLSVGYVFFGGFKFIFSGGDEGKIKQATNTIRHAILGLIITISAVVIVQVVGQLLGMDVISEIFNYNEISTTIQGLLDRLSGNGGNAASSSAGSVNYNFSKNY